MVWGGLSKEKGLLEVWAHLNPWPFLRDCHIRKRSPARLRIPKWQDLMISSKWNQQVITFTGSRIDGFHLDVLHENMKEPSSVVDSSPAESHPRYPEEMGPFSTTAGQLTDICSYPVVDKNLILAVIFGHGQSLESVLLCSWRDIFSSHSGCLIQKNNFIPWYHF